MTPTELFEQNMKLAPFTIQRYFTYLAQDEDYLQIAYIGLWRACNTFNENTAKFSTYATTCVHHEIIKTLRKKTIDTISAHTPIGPVRDGPDRDGTLDLMGTFIDPTDCYAKVEAEPDIDITPFTETLTPKQKLTLQALYQGLTATEMARATGVTPQSKSHDIRILKEKLKKYLSENMKGES